MSQIKRNLGKKLKIIVVDIRECINSWNADYSLPIEMKFLDKLFKTFNL